MSGSKGRDGKLYIYTNFRAISATIQYWDTFTFVPIISHLKIVEAQVAHPECSGVLDQWYRLAKRTMWRNLADVKACFPATDRVGDKCRRFTPHDFRSTCRSHLGALRVGVLIAERFLSHSLGGLVAVYDKHDYLPERRRALELWAAKLATIEAGAAFNVLPLKRA